MALLLPLGGDLLMDGLSFFDPTEHRKKAEDLLHEAALELLRADDNTQPEWKRTRALLADSKTRLALAHIQLIESQR